MLKSRIPAKRDAAFLLRSMNIRDSDVLVAGRVVEIDDDGSVFVLWRVLEKFAVPTLVPAQER